MKKTLRELGIKIYSGKIVQRLIADPLQGDVAVDLQRRTIVSKTVEEGYIDDDNIVLNDYKVMPDDEKLTKEGDIIIKLAPPYRAVIIDQEHEGMFVSSFCSIIRNVSPAKINKQYLIAYLNSEVCKRKFDLMTMGATAMAMLSNGKIYDLDVPIVDADKQAYIANQFFKMIENRQLLKRIIELEEEKLSSLIAGLED